MVKRKVRTIIWDTEALKHFKEILSYLEQHSEQAPKIVKDEIISRLNIIKASPLICEMDRLREPSDSSIRSFTVYSYRVTYQISNDSNEIRILRIRHTSREPLG